MTEDKTTIKPLLPCYFDLLVPHQPPILIRARLEEAGNSEGSLRESAVVAEVPLSGLFVHAGQVLPEYLIELLAQSIAAYQGYCSVVHGKSPEGGFLATIDRFIWHNNPIPAEQLRVTFRRELSFSAVHVFAGEVEGSMVQLAEGQVKISTNDNSCYPVNPTASAVTPCPSLRESLEQGALEKITPGKQAATFNFTENFPGFRGHFPGDPVLPAVAQVAAVQLLAEKLLGTRLAIRSASNIKFKEKVIPGQSVLIHMTHEQNDSEIKVLFSMTRGADQISSGTMIYNPIT